jgi:hypothetical protein
LKPVATEQLPLVGRKERPDPLTSAPDGAKDGSPRLASLSYPHFRRDDEAASAAFAPRSGV